MESIYLRSFKSQAVVVAAITMALVAIGVVTMLSRSQQLRVIKQPAYSIDSPSMKDYMRVLERFPLLGERGWKSSYLGDPNLGYFGDPDSGEMGLRSVGNFVFVMSLLASEPTFDEQVTGFSRKHLLERARTCLTYMTRSHVTGDINCGDGRKWGDHLQSAWWTAKMGVGASLIWEDLTAEERARVERVVVHEASRNLKRRARSESTKESQSNENAWDAEILAVAISLFPSHENAPGWRKKLIEFDVNSLSAPHDGENDEKVDSKLLRDQVYTENIHSDFTIENHGAYHFCYMACPLQSLSWGYYALRHGKQSIPEAQFHHFLDVWKRAKPTFLDNRFAYIGGKDWPRYCYGLCFIMPALVLIQQKFNDGDALFVEQRRFQTLEWEQLYNSDGSFFGRRFTQNKMMGRPLQCETDCYANLGLCYLLKKMSSKTSVRAPQLNEFEKNILDRHVSEEAGFTYVRGRNLFASISWRELRGPYPLALFVPKGMDDSCEWGRNNLLGLVEVPNIDLEDCEVQHKETMVGEGFKSEGEVIYHEIGGSPAYRQKISFQVAPEQRKAWIDSKYVADADITVSAIEGLRWHVVNDIFNDGKRHWYWDGGEKTVEFNLNGPYPEKENHAITEFRSRWINLDNKLGIVQLDAKQSDFALRQSNRRNAPFDSLHYDVLAYPPRRAGELQFKKGDVILHNRFLIVVGDRKRTEALAKSNK